MSDEDFDARTNRNAFFNWFAGFVDGEGHFAIEKRNEIGKNRYGYQCRFQINLRSDDYAIVCEIKERLGNIGKIYKDENRTGNANPIIIYRIHAIAECCKLVDILDAHPLRAKKAADYAIWSRAVMLCSQKSVHGGWKQSSPANWADIAPLYESLRTVRIFREYEEVDALILRERQESGKTINPDLAMEL